MSATRGSKIKHSGRPLVVGLTGSFGTGKSTVAKFFREKGARVIEADRIAHEVFQRGNPLHGRLRSLFPEIKGRLDRKKVARIVFGNDGRRRSLERLIHPYVFHRIRRKIRRTGRPVLVVEIPLLFESRFHHETDCNVVVTSDKKSVLKRLGRRGFQAAEIEARRRAQMPLQEKIRRADFIIDNSQGLRHTRAQVFQIWKKIERSLLKHAQRERNR